MTYRFIDLKKINPRERTLLIGLLIVIGIGLYAFNIHRPFTRRVIRYRFQIERAQARLDELKTKYPQVDKQRQLIRALNFECEGLVKEIDSIERRFPSRKNASQLLSEIGRLAKGVKLVSIRQKVKAAKDYSELFIELKFNAPYKEMISYIRDIESISPFLKIEELNVQEPKAAEGGAAVQLVLSSLLAETSILESMKAEEAKEALPVSRDIFVSKAKPQSPDKKLELKLDGITYNQENPTAIINDEVVKADSIVGSLTIKKILFDRVVLTDGVEEHVLTVER